MLFFKPQDNGQGFLIFDDFWMTLGEVLGIFVYTVVTRCYVDECKDQLVWYIIEEAGDCNHLITGT